MFLGVTGRIHRVAYTGDQQRRIAEAVRRARIDKRLDKEPAARAARVSSITWKRVEDAEGVRDASLGKILSSLGLEVQDILAPDGSRQRTSPPPQMWSTVGELSSRLGASLRAQADLFEWTRARLNPDDYPEHNELSEAAAEPLLSVAADFGNYIRGGNVTTKKGARDGVADETEPSASPEGDEIEEVSDDAPETGLPVNLALAPEHGGPSADRANEAE